MEQSILLRLYFGEHTERDGQYGSYEHDSGFPSHSPGFLAFHKASTLQDRQAPARSHIKSKK